MSKKQKTSVDSLELSPTASPSNSGNSAFEKFEAGVDESQFQRLTGIPVVRLGVDMTIGMSFTGVLVRVEPPRDPKKIKTGLVVFKHNNGLEYAFGLSKVLSSSMKDNPEEFVGRTLQIRYLGTNKSPGGKKDYHKLEVLMLKKG
jgi:hypothetical protein